MSRTIYKNVITLTVLTPDSPLDPDESLTGIDYAITEGDSIGGWSIDASTPITDREVIRAELKAIDNDGSFFDPVDGDDDDAPQTA